MPFIFNRNLGFATTQETKTKLSYPLTLLEVKKHLRLDDDFIDDDSYLENLIIVGTQVAENYIEKDIAYTQNELRIDDFSDDWIKIFSGNFVSLIGVYDSNDASIGTVHQTSKHDNFFQIEWTSSISSDPLTIKYCTGYVEDETPQIIKQSIMIVIGNLYDGQRSSVTWGGYADNKIWQMMLDPYKLILF
jgi:hypothetical protein